MWLRFTSRVLESLHPYWPDLRFQTGKLLNNEPALDKLQALRDRLSKPLIVRSAYRSPEHNRAVGGATRSKHLDGAAFDIAMSNHAPAVFEAAAREVGFLGFGFYPRSGFMHVDLGRHASGVKAFRRGRCPSPPRPAGTRASGAEPNHKGRWHCGCGDAWCGGRGGCGAGACGNADCNPAARPVSRLSALVFIAVALGGIAVTIYARLDDWKRGRR